MAWRNFDNVLGQFPPAVQDRLRAHLTQLRQLGLMPSSDAGQHRLISQLAAGSSNSNMKFRLPRIIDPVTSAGPNYQVPADVLSQQGRYVSMLERSLGGRFRSIGQGSQMQFEGENGLTFRMLNFGTTLSKKTGLPSGRSAVANFLELGANNAPTAVSAIDWIGNRLRPGMRPADISTINADVQKITRWVGNNGFVGMTPIDSFHARRFIVAPKHGGTASFNDIRLAGKSDLIAENAAKVLSHGLAGQPLFLDPLTETAAYRGVFSTMRASDYSWLGGLYKGGYKFGQAFRTLPMKVTQGLKDRAAAQYKGLGYASAKAAEATFHGRWINTGEMWEAGFKYKSGGSSYRMIQGMNVPTEVAFGARALKHFTDINQVILSRSTYGMLLRNTAFPGQRGPRNAAMGLHGTEKGMLAGVENLSHLGKFGAGAFRPGKIRDMSSYVELMTGGTIQAMLDRGASRKTIARALRAAAGSNNVLFPEAEHLILNTSAGGLTGRLFDVPAGLKPEQQLAHQLGQVSGFLGRLQKASGVSANDIFQWEGGHIVGARVNQFMGIRDVSGYGYKESLGLDLTLDRGQRMNQVLRAEALLGGNKLLADYYNDALGNPDIKKHISQVTRMGKITEHLLTGGTPGDIKGLGISPLAGFFKDSTKFNEMYAAAESRMAANRLAGVPVTGGVASIMQEYAAKHGVLNELFEGHGLTVGLGRNVTVTGAANIHGMSIPFQGAVDRIALGNVALMGGDQYAWNVMQLFRQGDKATSAIRSLTASALKQGVGGYGTLAHTLRAPRLGDVLKGLAQNPASAVSSASEHWQTLMNAQLSREMSIGGSKDQLLKSMAGAEYVFLNEGQFKRLPAHIKEQVAKRGYASGIMYRDPHTLRDPVAVRLAFSKGVARGSGMVMRQGPLASVSGDTDYDWLNMLLAGDDRLQAAFAEVESNQRPRLEWNQRLAEIKYQQEIAGVAKLESTQKLMADIQAGTVDPSNLTAEQTALLGKSIPFTQEAGRMAAEKVKTLTPLVSPHVLHEAEVMSAIYHSGQGPSESLSLRQYQVLAETVPARVEMALSKHSDGGTDTLQLLRTLNDNIKAMANINEAGAAGKSFDEMFARSYSSFVPEGSPGYLFQNAHEVFGPDVGRKVQDWALSGSGDYKALDQLIKSGMGTGEYQNFRSRSLSLLKQVSDVRGKILDAGILPFDKKHFSVESAKRGLRSQLMSAGYLDDVTASVARLVNQQQTMETVNLGEAAIQQAATSSATGSTAGSIRSAAAKQATGFVRNHPLLALGLGVAAVAGASAFAVNRFMGKASEVKQHIADQMASDYPPAPESQYVMSPWDQTGMSVSMAAQADPSVIRMGPDIVNQLNGPTDLRIIDSRMGVSDRILGNRARHQMKSLYA